MSLAADAKYVGGTIGLFRRMSPRGAGCVGITFLVILASCGGDGPVDVAKEFVGAAASGNARKLYALLTPESQHKLAELSALATKQMGSAGTVEPHRLLATSLDSSPYVLRRIELVSRDSHVAKVRLVDREQKTYETLMLQYVDNHWRVILPESPQLGQF